MKFGIAFLFDLFSLIVLVKQGERQNKGSTIWMHAHYYTVQCISNHRQNIPHKQNLNLTRGLNVSIENVVIHFWPYTSKLGFMSDSAVQSFPNPTLQGWGTFWFIKKLAIWKGEKVLFKCYDKYKHVIKQKGNGCLGPGKIIHNYNDSNNINICGGAYNTVVSVPVSLLTTRNTWCKILNEDSLCGMLSHVNDHVNGREKKTGCKL